jgi:hypothetical protein
MAKILCGGPVSEGADVFSAHVDALLAQGHALDYKGIDGSPTPLQAPQFGFDHVDWRYEGSSGEYKQRRVRWNGARLRLMGRVRDEMRRAALTGEYDYLFMVDSDMILGPGTLDHMLFHCRDIVAGLVWTKYKAWTKRVWPNVWRINGNKPDTAPHVAPDDELLVRINVGGLHQVEVTGGCYLISRHALERTSFAPLPDTASEDLCFAKSAKAAGLPIYLDCDVSIEHRRRR